MNQAFAKLNTTTLLQQGRGKYEFSLLALYILCEIHQLPSDLPGWQSVAFFQV